MFGRLPKTAELNTFRDRLRENAHINEAMKIHFEAFPAAAPPMAILSAMINTLACFNPDELMIQGDDESFEVAGREIDQQGADDRRVRLPPQQRAAVYLSRCEVAVCRELPAP